MLLIHLLVGVLLLVGTSCKDNTNDPPPSKPNSLTQPSTLPTTTLDIAGETFTVELAYRQMDRTRGLMYRDKLEAQAGMLFIFERARPRTFHMANCLIDLDIAFLDAQGRIVNVLTMRKPAPGGQSKLYHSAGPAQYALELPVGTAARLSLKAGQTITLNDRIRKIIPDAED